MSNEVQSVCERCPCWNSFSEKRWNGNDVVGRSANRAELVAWALLMMKTRRKRRGAEVTRHPQEDLACLPRYLSIDRVQKTDQHSSSDHEEDHSMGLGIDQCTLTLFDQTIEKNTFESNRSKSIDFFDHHLGFLSNLFGLSSMITVTFEKSICCGRITSSLNTDQLNDEHILKKNLRLTIEHDDTAAGEMSVTTIIFPEIESVVVVQRFHSLSTYGSVHWWTAVEQCHEHFVQRFPNDGRDSQRRSHSLNKRILSHRKEIDDASCLRRDHSIQVIPTCFNRQLAFVKTSLTFDGTELSEIVHSILIGSRVV